MDNIQLKEEWLEKVKITKKEELGSYATGRYTVNTQLHLAPPEIKSDYDINYTAAIIGKEFIWNLDTNLVQNKDFIMKLVNDGYTKSNHVFSYLHGELSYDIELFKMCLDNQDKIVWSLSKKLIEQRDAILDIFKEHDFFTQFKGAYNYDKEFMQIHLDRHPSYFKDMRKSMQNYFGAKSRKSYVLGLMKQGEAASYIYPYISNLLKEDLEVIDLLLSKSKSHIDLLPKELLDDKAFMLYAIDKYDCNIKECSAEIKNDIDIVKLRISKHGHELLYYPQFRDNLEFIHLALQSYPNLDLLTKEANNYYSPSKPYANKNALLSNRDLVIKFLKADPTNCEKLLKETTLYENDYDIVKLNVIHDSKLLERSNKWKNDTELSQIALLKSNDITLLSEELFTNKDLILRLLEKEKKNSVLFFTRNNFLNLYREDLDIIKKILVHEPTFISRFPEGKCNEELVYFAIKHGLQDLKHIDSSLYTNKDIALAFLEKNMILNFPQLPKEIRNDHNFLIKILEKNSSHYSTIISHSNVYKDLDFHVAAIQKNSEVFLNIMDKSPFKFNKEIIVAYVNSDLIENIQLPQKVYIDYEVSNAAELRAKLNYDSLENKIQQKEELPTYKKIKI